MSIESRVEKLFIHWPNLNVSRAANYAHNLVLRLTADWNLNGLIGREREREMISDETREM